MASNMFINFTDVEGESTDLNHDKWIEILSWNHSFSQPASALRDSSGSTVERANHSDFSFTKCIDVATDDILKAIWSGKQFDTVDMECFRADGENLPVKYLMVNMEKVIISNYSISGGGGDLPMENLSLAYGKVTYTYIDQKKEDAASGGNQPTSHDLTTNEVG